MAKETQKEQIARLEAENERLSKNFNDCFAENQQLEKKLNARVEETDEYISCIHLYPQLLHLVFSQAADSQRNTAIEQRDRYHAKVQQLEAERDTLRKQLEQLQAAYNAYKQVHEESQRNPFGAGRKRSYLAQLEQIMQLRESGSSIRAIHQSLIFHLLRLPDTSERMNQNNTDSPQRGV